MFLKSEEFSYGGESVMLYELSALQRVEYLEFIQKSTAEYDALPEDATKEVRSVAYLKMGVVINAWLVSRSIFNGENASTAVSTGSGKDSGGQGVEELHKIMSEQWSYEALGKGADVVLALSGMNFSGKDGDTDGDEKGEEEVLPEKS
ncbi:TPA: phage minor tail protein G [Salmonella enterica]|uniref:Phage minor tail protein G n=1 Tax=Salmonella enterica TaxID=28901 RepID=A0A403SY72_SALER|nr:phage minor tail protein G [Salmonella enterica]HAF4825300.1 phage minor tail protein G [Salmonella enterica]